jgi:hypothetical protein
VSFAFTSSSMMPEWRSAAAGARPTSSRLPVSPLIGAPQNSRHCSIIALTDDAEKGLPLKFAAT